MQCGGVVAQPVLLLYYTGDNTVFPSDVSGIFDTLASSDKQRHDIRGNHHGHAIVPGDPLPQDTAGAHIARWLRERFLAT